MITTGRFRRTLLAAGCLLAAAGAHAQSATIFQQSFSSGLGTFVSAGTVKTGATGAVMVGATFTADGSITSAAINASGYTGLSVSFDRTTAGMGSITIDGGVFEYSVNGGAFTKLESTRVTTLGRTTLALPATANGASIKLRFRANALSSSESYTVNNVVLSGTSTSTSGGGGGGGGQTGGTASAPPITEFATFESGHVRPMALSSDGQRLYVVNTPDAKVEVYDVSGNTPVLKESIPVGLEPVAVALAPNGQLWVVNHLSDNVSIVDVSASPARVVNTLYVGDEPRDIVFAGAGNRFAFITAAHRGQNTAKYFDAKLSTPSTGRADVWVFDANDQGSELGGKAVKVLNMFGDTLRGLARNAEGTRVYTAVLNSGNRTTIAQGGLLSTLPKTGPTTAADGSKAPSTGLIVQKNANGDWVDGGDPQRGIAPKTWNTNIRLNLPDNDVFTIDATKDIPEVIEKASNVGTTLFNLAVNPVNNKVYVTNQDARNLVRFEGPGKNSTTVNGHFVEARITVLDGSGNVTPRHLNKHITSYGSGVGTAAEKAAAVATPLEMAFTPDGSTVYMASMGTNKLVRYSTSELEGNSFTPSPSSQVLLSGGLPTGVVLDAERGRAFVTTRLDNGLSVVNTGNLTESAHVTMANPEPADVVKGRKFLYDATYTSSRGDSSCAGCHIFGDMDHLGWDLGNPDEVRVKNGNTYNSVIPPILKTTVNFHPMKGPMTTQSFRGMAGNGPMHWRGDRQGKSTGATLEERAFKDFSVAFPGLLGRDVTLSDAEMTDFARFALKLKYPPNPVQNLDTSYTMAQQAGADFYVNKNADNLTTCNGCHKLDPLKGQFGTDGTMTFEGPTISENFKIAQLRNAYQKVGYFARNDGKSTPSGDQIRGWGYSVDGGLGSVSEFLNAAVFLNVSAANRKNLEEFVLAYPSDLFPVVGQQVTVTPTNAAQADVTARLNLLVQRAGVTSPRPECELIAKGVVGGVTRGWVHSRATNTFVPDRKSDAAVSLSNLLALGRTNNSALTFTCAPPGNGTRLGIDRNADGTPDGG